MTYYLKREKILAELESRTAMNAAYTEKMAAFNEGFDPLEETEDGPNYESALSRAKNKQISRQEFSKYVNRLFKNPSDAVFFETHFDPNLRPYFPAVIPKLQDLFRSQAKPDPRVVLSAATQLAKKKLGATQREADDEMEDDAGAAPRRAHPVPSAPPAPKDWQDGGGNDAADDVDDDASYEIVPTPAKKKKRRRKKPDVFTPSKPDRPPEEDEKADAPPSSKKDKRKSKKQTPYECRTCGAVLAESTQSNIKKHNKSKKHRAAEAAAEANRIRGNNEEYVRNQLIAHEDSMNTHRNGNSLAGVSEMFDDDDDAIPYLEQKSGVKGSGFARRGRKGAVGGRDFRRRAQWF